MNTPLRVLLAALLPLGFVSTAFAVDESRYLLRLYRFNPGVAIKIDAATWPTAETGECALRDVGAAMTNGKLELDGAVALIVNGELSWGAGATSGAVPESYCLVPAAHRGADAEPLDVVAGIALHDPIDVQEISFDPAEAEYLEPRADDTYQLQRIDPPPGLTLSLNVPAPGRLQLTIAQNVALGRVPLLGSALSAGKPILKSCTITGELAASAGENYVGLLSLASSEPCLLVIAPAPPPVPPIITKAPAFSTEICILRLDDDALIRDPRCHAVEGIGIEGARAFQLEPALWDDAFQDRFPGELLSAPRLTLPDAALPPKEGDSLFKIVIRGPLPTPTGKLIASGAPRVPGRLSEDTLKPFIAWFGGDSARFLSFASMRGGGVIIDNSSGGAQTGFGGCDGCVDPPPVFPPTGPAYVGVIRCSSTDRAGTIKRELYLAIRASGGENETTRSLHGEANALLDVPYAFVPTAQPDSALNVFLVKTTKIEAGQSAFFDVASGSSGAK